MPTNLHRTLRPLALTAVAAVLLAACSSSESVTPPPMPSTVYAGVTELVPVGPHEVELTFTLGPSTTTVSGYLELPAGYDLVQDCAFELSAVETRAAEDDTVESTAYDFSKTKGGPAWRQATQSTDELLADQIDRWFAGDDPNGPAPVILLPQLLLDDMAGGEYWCNLRHTDQVARLVDPATGRLSWDRTAFADAIAANMDAWLVAMVDAASLTGSRRAEVLATGRKLAVPQFEGLLGGIELEASRTANGIEWVAYSADAEERSVMITATFTPTDPRAVEPVTGAQTFAEQLATDEAVRDAFFDGF